MASRSPAPRLLIRMSVAMNIRSRTVAAAAAVSLLCGALWPPAAWAQGDKERSIARGKRAASKAPARAQQAPLRDGQAE
ncbi:hypothetical protein HMI51_43360, partial [Corallococcus coralloides]|nr:hypothetical protein [Corallococcus coralloides]